MRLPWGVKPFYRGEKVTVIGAITLQEVVALMTIDNTNFPKLCYSS